MIHPDAITGGELAAQLARNRSQTEPALITSSP
jgi:hypothetical protein